MKLSLNDYVKLCINRYIKDSGITELEVVIDPKRQFIQINHQVYASKGASIIVDVVPGEVIDWNDDIDSELKEKYKIIRTNEVKATKSNIKTIKESNSNSNNPKIGIFYYIMKDFKTLSGGKLEYLAQDVIDVITNNTKYISAPYMHVNMWENIRFLYKKYTGYAYGTLPRGRVIYDIENSCYVIVMDRCLMTKAIVNKIVKEFKIPTENFRVEDELFHYNCFRCNGELDLEDYEVFSD